MRWPRASSSDPVELADLVAALDGLAASDFTGAAYRHVAVGRQALSGEGARLTGGRWNPPGSFAVLYLALDIPTAVREFRRLVQKQGLAPEDFLPRDLLTYDVGLQHVIDLRNDQHARAVGLDGEWLAHEDPSRCQQVGEAAHHAGFEGLLAPSAAGSGDVLAVFLDRTLPDSLLQDVASERWSMYPASILTHA